MAYKIFAVDLREMPAHFNRLYKEVHFSAQARQLVHEIGLQLQPDPRLAGHNSFDIYFTPPTTPNADKKVTIESDYDWPEISSRRAVAVDKSGTTGKSQTTIKLFTKFRKPNHDRVY